MTALPEGLARNLAEQTVRIGPNGAPADDDAIVFAEPNDSLADAFRIARALCDAGRAVRIIAPGATLSRAWPEWVPKARALALTEWGALTHLRLLDSTGALQDEMRAWVRAMAGDAFGPVAADRVLFANLCLRALQRVLTAHAVARSLALAFPRARVTCVHPGSLTAQLIDQNLARLRPDASFEGAPAGEGRRPSRLGEAAWRAKIGALGAAAMAVSLASLTRLYRDAQPTFRALRAHGANARARDEVDTWFLVMPDWLRANRHLFDALALPMAESGATLGVMFIGSAAPGARDEHDMKGWLPSEQIWPGLEPLRPFLDRYPLEQAVMPASPGAFARALGRGVRSATRLLARLAESPRLCLPSVDVDLSEYARPLVSWATLDVLRATLAQAAADEVCARAPGAFAGKDAISVGSNNPQHAVVDVTLQNAGAITFDHTHGAGLDRWSGDTGAESTVRCVWTYADARGAATSRLGLLVTGMPVGDLQPPRTRPPRRVILMTSGYVHRDLILNGRFPYEMFQAEVLDVIPRLRALGHTDLEFRWRPHPADNEPLVMRDYAALRDVALSRGVPLAEDAAWADVIVASYSTVIFETLFAGVPVFVHAVPELWRIPAGDFLEPSRLFFRAEDGAAKVSRWLRERAQLGDEALGPEHRERVRLFGPTGEPIPMTAYFGAARARRPKIAAGMALGLSSPTDRSADAEGPAA